MRFFGKAEQAAQTILQAFQNPGSLPEPLANLFIRRQDNAPCRKWSWRNQFLIAVNGFSDARGFRQWQQVGRWVRKGEKAFHILTPVAKRILDEDKGEERTIIVGFSSAAVFGLEQTDGAPLPLPDPETQHWIESLPFIEVARSWGLSVESFNGEKGRPLGVYQVGKGISLGVQNLGTWAHELLHAADDRLGNVKADSARWQLEIVAELGSAVLLRAMGYEHDCNLGGCWRYVNRYAAIGRIEVIDACGRVLERTCRAVALILDTAAQLKEQPVLL